MSWLPTGTALGTLQMQETLVEYDGPRVFSCQSLTGQRYIAGWAEERQEDDLWLYLPVSEARLISVRSGGLTLREAFERPEGFVYLVTLPTDPELGPDRVEPLLGGSLQEEWLPAPEFRLELQTPTLPAAETGDMWRRRAVQESRSRIRLEVKLPRTTRSEAPTKKVGELLVSTQSLYDNFGLALMRTEPPQAGPIPLDVAEETSSDVVGLAAASFVVELASSNYDDLLGESTFAEITRRVLALLDVSLEREGLIEQLTELRPRGAKSFRNFVRGLASTGGGVTVAAVGTALEYSERELSPERLQTLRQILNNLVPDDAYEIRGHMLLYRGDTERKQFGVRDELTDARYEGSIAERALPQVHLAALDQTYEVLIYETSTYDEAVSQRKAVYVLEQLVPIEPGTPLMPVVRTRITESAVATTDDGS